MTGHSTLSASLQMTPNKEDEVMDQVVTTEMIKGLGASNTQGEAERAGTD